MKVLILPGLDGTGLMLTDFVARLESRNTVQAIQYPSEEQLTYSNLADIVISQLPKSEPYIIIAESFSGPIAALITSKNPLDLRAVIFAASFLSKPIYLPKVSAILTNIMPLKSGLLLRLGRPFTFGKWASTRLNNLLKQAMARVSSKVLASRIKEVMQVDELMKLKGMNFPLLYIRPSNDRLVSRKALNAMKAINPKIEVKEVLGPHFILQANPQGCANVITKFIARISDDI